MHLKRNCVDNLKFIQFNVDDNKVSLIHLQEIDFSTNFINFVGKVSNAISRIMFFLLT